MWAIPVACMSFAKKDGWAQLVELLCAYNVAPSTRDATGTTVRRTRFIENIGYLFS